MANPLHVNDNNRVNVRKWQLVLCDLDGTLLDQASMISSKNLTAVAALAEHQIGFTLATGRMDAMTRLFVRQLQITLPIIACNGAVIRDCTTNELLSQICLVPDDVIVLTEWMARHGVDYLVYTPDAVYYPPKSRRIEVMHQYNVQASAHKETVVPLFELNTHSWKQAASHAVKILAIIPDSPIHAELRMLLSMHQGCEAVMSMDYAMDIMAAGVTKGAAMQQLAKMIGVRPDSIVALGDHDNDVSMLQRAGLGIAMGNATQLAVAASRARTLTNSESGVAAAIWRYVLPE